MSPRWARADRTDRRDAADMTDPALSAEAIDKIDANEPIEPTDKIEPTEPIDNTEPLEAIDRKESSDHRDRRELFDGTSSACRKIAPAAPGPQARGGHGSSLGCAVGRHSPVARPSTRSRLTATGDVGRRRRRIVMAARLRPEFARGELPSVRHLRVWRSHRCRPCREPAIHCSGLRRRGKPDRVRLCHRRLCPPRSPHSCNPVGCRHRVLDSPRTANGARPPQRTGLTIRYTDSHFRSHGPCSASSGPASTASKRFSSVAGTAAVLAPCSSCARSWPPTGRAAVPGSGSRPTPSLADSYSPGSSLSPP